MLQFNNVNYKNFIIFNFKKDKNAKDSTRAEDKTSLQNKPKTTKRTNRTYTLA